MDKKPKLIFSKWYTWKGRNNFPDIKYPGVYMIAITDKNLSGTKPNFKDVKYIGMTNSQGGLCSRWNQFFRSIRGNRGHSGGNTIFSALGHYLKWNQNLFVCGMSIKCNTTKSSRTPNDLIRMGWVAFLEYEAISKFKKEIGKEPKYNTK